jgi:phosphoglycerol transferase MdoB-like AlkP superfamily enzyme
MGSNAGLIESLFEKGASYSKTTIDLVRLKAIDKSAEVVSSVTARLAVVIVVALAGLIVNIGIALWIGELLGRSYYGFFIMGGFYFLVAILLYRFRHQWIKTPVSNSLITQLSK